MAIQPVSVPVPTKSTEDEQVEEYALTARIRHLLANTEPQEAQRFTQALGQALARGCRQPDGVQPNNLAIALLLQRLQLLEQQDSPHAQAEARILRRDIVGAAMALWGVFDFGSYNTPVSRWYDELLTFDEVMELEPPSWLITDILPAAGVTVLYGAPGSYKSFVALDLAAHFVLGWDWCGKPTAQPWGYTLGGMRRKHNRGLYVAGEGTYVNRNQAWYLHHGRPHIGRDLLFKQRPVNLLNDAEVEWLLEVVLDNDIELVVIDTLSRAITGADENSAQEITPALEACTRLGREANCAVLLVHHTGKDPSRGERGTSAIQGNADARLECRKPAPLRCVLYNRKQKESESEEQIRLRLQKVAWEGFRPGDSLVAVPDTSPPPAAEAGSSKATSEQFAKATAVARQLRETNGEWPSARQLADHPEVELKKTRAGELLQQLKQEPEASVRPFFPEGEHWTDT